MWQSAEESGPQLSMHDDDDDDDDDDDEVQICIWIS